MKSKQITMVALLLGMVMLSGCIESTHHPEVPMSKIIEYPIVVVAEDNMVLVMFENGEVTMKYHGEVCDAGHWRLKIRNSDYYAYTLSGLCSLYVTDDSQKFIAKGLILDKDGTARFGSSEGKVILDGKWW